MTGPPAMKLRSATVLDRDRLFEIHRAALGPYVEQTWGWDEAWQREHFRKHFDLTGLSVIQCDGREVGFMQVARRPDATWLHNIEIEPDYQGRGLGTLLVRALLEDARKRRIPVRLQVLRVNERARWFYERLGFTATGETDTHDEMEWRA